MSAKEAPKLLTFALLRQLADGEFHSGQVLARQFGVTRATVNNAVRDVESYGLTLDSVREIQDHAASSNALLLQRAAQAAASGTVLAVEWQTAGRGRLGRTWHSGLGDTLTFSLLWRFGSGLAALSGLSLAVGIAMMRALRELGVPGVGLKWPNDVLLNDGKLAGVLLEAQGDMLGPSAVVIGIGLNLSVPEGLRGRIDQRASDLASLDMPTPERNAVLAVLLKHLVAVLHEFGERGFVLLREEWESHHVFRQRPVKLILPDGSHIAGMVLGVTDDGALRLATAQGEQVFNAGEVSLRSA
jgi:BirA family biotin operon repressor/biotin-[acetyl-CoA-carboxylase] ligase